MPVARPSCVTCCCRDCGSCHGLRLTGGPRPGADPEALRGKPRESLVAAVLMGRPQTPMPPWAGLLSEDDAGWLVDRLIEGGSPHEPASPRAAFFPRPARRL